MAQRTFKIVTECDCDDKEGCNNRGIPRDKVYQSLADAKLHAFVQCSDDFYEMHFMEVKEEI